jgi:hydrogenase maturation factor
MKIGKLSHDQLRTLVLDRLPAAGADILAGPAIGLDCAAVRVGDGLIVVSSDPITGAAAEIGRLAVHISCNDIATCGIRPSLLTLVLIAPPTCRPDDIRQVIDQAAATAAHLGVSIVGGHTEVSDAVSRMVVVTTAIGQAQPGQPLILAGGGRAGDMLLMTKTAGLEGTAILAADRGERLSGSLSPDELAQAAGMIEQISVVAEGACAGRLGAHALHDATEGGILGAVWELAQAGRTGCLVWADQIPIDPLTRRICQLLDLDPLRLIASGSLIIATDRPAPLIAELSAGGILCTAIGRLSDDGRCRVRNDAGTVDLAPPGPDELYKII